MKKNEKAFVINVMWVPLFVGIMTAILSKGTAVDPYIVGAFMGFVGTAMCYLDYILFIKKGSNKESDK